MSQASQQYSDSEKAIHRKSGGPAAAPDRRETRRWWLKLILQPALFLSACALLLAGIGAAQRFGWLSTGAEGRGRQASSDKTTRYICPMLCTPPQLEPGRCPVCKMELVPATSGAATIGANAIQIDPVARRLANIHTVAVKAAPFSRTIRAIGELKYDEGNLKTIAAYVDGRLEKLYADFTGVDVKKGHHLALVYSPQLYTGQVELLAAKNAGTARRSVLGDLYESARQKLLDLGMTEEQIDDVEKTGKANSRIYLCAPISGTVIEKFAVEGQYVKEGQPIYKLADLSSVWLMLKMFPEDAAVMHYGQKVAVKVQSLPRRKFTGRVAFIDPMVEPKTRTVGVRVVLPNDKGLLRVGDYAKATVNVAECALVDSREVYYDPELAGKFISPRHPQIIQSSPGKCPLCGIDLVPAAKFGYADRPVPTPKRLLVPRSAVLMAGDDSVVYVETEPGRFEIRRVVLGPGGGDEIVIRKGVKAGERVATSGNFLIDSQMQLAGNPSLIDPSKAQPESASRYKEEFAKLSAKDRALAEKQRICPVTELRLGSMGPPIKVDVQGKAVFICCDRCRKSLLREPEKYLAILAASAEGQNEPEVAPQTSLPPIGVPKLVAPDAKSPEGAK